MAVANRPLRRRRRTAQRGKPMTQSQRWGKVTIMTPTPNGEITSTQTWDHVPPVTDEAIVAADAEEATEEYSVDEENDQA